MTIQASDGAAPRLDAEPREISISTRQASTTIDALEKEFHRKKQRELEAASFAGAGDASQPKQRRTGEKVGRNDPCPCGSGKKFRKCCGEAGATPKFDLGKYEVTQEQWQAVMGANPSYFQDHPQRPIETVSWNETRGGDWPGGATVLPASVPIPAIAAARAFRRAD